MSGRSSSRAAQRATKPRDQAESTFTTILERLVKATPGALGVALVDHEGECVDYAGAFDTFELKVTAAHWQLVVSQLDEAKLGAVRQIVVHARTRSYLLRLVNPSYSVILVLHRHAAFAPSERALQEAHHRLAAEAGWPSPGDPAWFGVEIQPEPSDRTRPALLRNADGWHPVEVMGCMVGLRPREKGFRVRLPSGAEMMLVRERRGRWFADEHVEG